MWIFLLALPLEQTTKYRVMREKGTERAFSGRYLYETASGTYHCADCNCKLFDSKDKYDANTGWPCFTKAISKKCIYYLKEEPPVFNRYEVLCRSCNAHLGHVFHDGPPPLGLRYTINSAALDLQVTIMKTIGYNP